MEFQLGPLQVNLLLFQKIQHRGLDTVLPRSPHLLIEVMPDDQTTKEKRDLKIKVGNALLSGNTKAVWLIFKNLGPQNLNGVQVHTTSYNHNAHFLAGDEVLDDGGDGLNVTAAEILAL